MNFGLIFRNALQRAELPLTDSEHLELGRSFANDAIQELWYLTKADFREGRDTLNLINGSDEYILNKLYDGMLPNALRGPVASPRTLTYLDPTAFFRKVKGNSNTKGTPNYFTYGDLVGFDQQITTGSQIRVQSSLASKVTGTVNVKNGSKRVVATTNDQFTINDIGLRFQKSGDSPTYKIAKFVDHKNIDLEDVYRGTSQDGANYKIGDVGSHANIQGFVGGQIDSEDVLLDGSNWITTSKNFGTLVSCSKSALTGGRITFQTSDGVQTLATLAPGETEVERQTIVLWPVPSAAETLRYRFYLKHPIFRLDTDRPLIPSKYHNLLTDMIEARLKEWAGLTIGEYLAQRISQGKEKFINDSGDTSLWSMVPADEGRVFIGENLSSTGMSDPDFW